MLFVAGLAGAARTDDAMGVAADEIPEIDLILPPVRYKAVSECTQQVCIGNRPTTCRIYLLGWKDLISGSIRVARLRMQIPEIGRERRLPLPRRVMPTYLWQITETTSRRVHSDSLRACANVC